MESAAATGRAETESAGKITGKIVGFFFVCVCVFVFSDVRSAIQNGKTCSEERPAEDEPTMQYFLVFMHIMFSRSFNMFHTHPWHGMDET